MHTIRFDGNGRWTKVSPQEAAKEPAADAADAALETPDAALETPDAAPETPDAPAAITSETAAAEAPVPGTPASSDADAPAEVTGAPEGQLRDPVEIEADVIKAIQTVYDPEIPVDIHQLGLIYGVHVDEESRVLVTMTLTTPGCEAAQVLPAEVKRKSEAVDGVRSAKVEVVWDPPWNMSMMGEAAKLALNMMW